MLQTYENQVHKHVYYSKLIKIMMVHLIQIRVSKNLMKLKADKEKRQISEAQSRIA
jgi:hypothetical protein